MRSRRFTAVVSAVLGAAVVIGVSACAPASPSPTSGATTGASSSATPSTTPTPTAAALAPPQVRVGVTCDQVAPIAQINAALGTNVAANPDSQPSSLRNYAFTQDGAIDCSFLGTASGSQTEYEVLVMPDITPKRWNQYKTYLAQGADITSPFGANSYVDCESSPQDLKCNLDMLVGTTWLSIQDFSDQVASSLTLSQALTRFKPALQTAVSAVKSATVAEPLWTDSDATAVNIADNVAFQNVIISATGVKYRTEVYAPDVIAIGTSSEAMYPVGYQLFGGGGGKYGITIEVLPAGAWAWSDLTSKVSSLSGYATLTGLGDQAVGFSEATTDVPHDYAIAATKGHNVITIDVDSGSSVASTLPSLAKKIAAAVLSQIN
jgi:hypothetical protein